MLVWYNNGPWKRTIISREELPHSYPKPHTDLLEKFINYSVPPEKFDDLAMYDGASSWSAPRERSAPAVTRKK